MLASPDSSWTVVCEPDAAPRPTPLHRFVRVHPVASRDQLATALAPLLPHLAGVALAGFGAGQDSVAAELREFGATRVCAPGELQFPPLDWRRDGLPPLSSLLKGIQD
jgi:hypothetical protein